MEKHLSLSLNIHLGTNFTNKQNIKEGLFDHLRGLSETMKDAAINSLHVLSTLYSHALDKYTTKQHILLALKILGVLG